MKKHQQERLEKFYHTLSDQELKDILACAKQEEEIRLLVTEELRKRKEKEAYLLACIERNRKYAMFFSRALAFFIDLTVVSSPLIFLIPFNTFRRVYSGLVALDLNGQMYYSQGMRMISVFFVYYGFMTLVYSTVLIGKFGATLGHNILRIRIVDYREQPLSYREALLRKIVCLLYFIPYLGGVLIFVSTITCCLMKRRQMLHDLICKNLVLKFKRQKELDF